jgi:pyruvate dehydrogenase E2 component (dihydrolipoamide acetyltransferase)
MATAVVMPRFGNSVESSIIVSWKKKKGDTVAEGEALCEIETDKATMEVPSPASGTLLDLFYPEGADVPVMTNIAAVGQPGESADALRPEGAAPPADPIAAPVSPSAPSFPTTAALSETQVSIPANGEIFISPRARNLAARKGIEVAGIEGTGPGGRIIERDVQAALTTQPKLTPLAKAMVEKGGFVPPAQGGRITSKDLIAPTAPETSDASVGARHAVPLQPEDDITVIPVKGTRKVIAARMLESLQTTAQLTLNAFADARALQDYRKKLKNSPEALGLNSVTINDLVLFAVSRALLRHPDLNALFTGDAINQYKNVHLGFAVDTPRGLIVPVIRNANTLSLKGIATESKRLASAVQDGTIKPDEMSGGTFTVTNLGSLGIDTFTPILNPPQVAILGVGGINLKPVEAGGDVKFIPHLSLSLTINHQVVDGAPGARFLQTLSQNLAQIDVLLAL